ncbi:uncharacterized protein EV420DRAFT_1190473 [Desarmillaria tabescens]|uniref:Uncharacterized protein n=1 Tax=Armillaria tabescens TaxID=1929756 RepID=A0AA39NBG9_ARMTA|nr:uncharacterized protein EV420DRAFT_1190473 [Desarmillaria tabescens]KAK0462484.1 hypothetical protein EV420DRAFT_1190473 [Desarmillaria tabescens]
MSVLDAFKLKSYDLEPVYAAWENPPLFSGDGRDESVDDWLKKVKDGCQEKNVPKEYWHKVAQKYMGEKAKARLEELKVVMRKVHGGNYRWNWQKFKIAMRNLEWHIDATATTTVKVHAKSSGHWWTTRKKDEPESPITEEPVNDLQISKKEKEVKKERPPPLTGAKSTSGDFFRPLRRASTTDAARPQVQKAKSDLTVTCPSPTRSSTTDQTVTTVANAPVWLLNACNALDFLTSEHPKVMSTISAILITAGSLPAIPAVAAGAGGAVLASGAAQAVGAIAVGLGSWLRAQQDGHTMHSPTTTSSVKEIS